MAISAFPINTVPPAANLITYTPFGIVTATDVQAAIQQLTSAIPAVGSGTDPLFLVNGLSVSANNPTFSGNATDIYAAKIHFSTDCSVADPAFGNNTALQAEIFISNGQATYGGGTNAKESFYCFATTALCYGSGQKFIYNNRLVSYGMSDTFLHARDQVEYAGGPVNGDEGCGWGSVSACTQQNHITTAIISSLPTQSLINTTITVAGVPASKSIQTINVASTAGVLVGDWVVVGQELPTASMSMEAVKLTGVGPGTISGVFRCNHNIGTTITPALRIVLNTSFEFGQDRVIVNLSGASYTTGQVNFITGAGFGGTGGANWTVNMVGGNTLNIGAIALTSDDYTGGYPFNDPLLKSWYLIHDIATPTFLGIFRTSVAGDGAYVGKGVTAGPTAYTIRPSARILRIVPTADGNISNEIICDTSTSTWTVGNTIECVICPYPDVTGFSYDVSNFANGGTLRGVLAFRNMGVRAYESCISIGDLAWPFSNVGADGYSFGAGLSISAFCHNAINITPRSIQAAIHLGNADGGAPNTDAGGAIIWGSDTNYLTATGIFCDNTESNSLTINTSGTNAGIGFAGQLKFSGAGGVSNPEANKSMMKWRGYIWMPNLGGRGPYLRLDNSSVSNTNYESAFFRWLDFSGICELGTEKGSGGGSARPLLIKTDNITRIDLNTLGDVAIGTGALATGANNGFLYIPTCPGPPTGNPTAYSGRMPLIYDTTNNKLYVYNGAWKGVVLT